MICIAGFPGSEHDYIGKPLVLRKADLPNFHIVLEGTAEDGQSGGPIMDKSGRVVAIVSENNSKQNPKYHTAVIASAPLDYLNEYLRQRGRSALALEEAGTGASRLKIVDRQGSAQVVLSGDSGELELSRQAKTDGTPEISLRGTGNEQSDCLPAFGAWTSSASGTAAVRPFEITGLRFRLQAAANGGHYTKAASCVQNNPVGFTPVDTKATSMVLAEGTIAFEPENTIPFDLRLAWREMPPLSEIRLIDPLLETEAEIEASAASERFFRIDKSGKWQVKLKITAKAEALGNNKADTSAQPLIFLEAR